ncbi:MAG TPA: hypothetical protein VKT50_06495 [Candidatus Acidoferrales bacterium]|nr:hypothetical protein [Candidatus Acidoferrales bacterium]
MKRLVLLLSALAVTASAAGIAGTWKAPIKTPTVTFYNVFTFKMVGGKLTGTLKSGNMAPLPISDIKLDHNEISFVVIQKSEDHDFKMTYTGTTNGDEMKLVLHFPIGGRTQSMVAKKVP